MAGRAGRDRQPVRLDAGDQRPIFLRRTLLRPARGAEVAEEARHPAGLRQQERRSHRARALELSGPLPANDRLLTPDDFVTWRVNWDDKVDNIRSIAEELGFALETFLFIDDNPVERERVRQRLPEVEVWGEDPFSLRRRLLNDPRLQIPVVTAEAASRSELVKAQIARQQLRSETMGEAEYIEGLQIKCVIERLPASSPKLQRVEELFQRTTQFNTTGRKFSASELADAAADPGAWLFAVEVSDRLGDYGLVGAAVIVEAEIAGFAISCRALGMGIEHRFLRHILDAVRDGPQSLSARIIPTPRNIPARNIYRDNGFVEAGPGLWRFEKQIAVGDGHASEAAE